MSNICGLRVPRAPSLCDGIRGEHSHPRPGWHTLHHMLKLRVLWENLNTLNTRIELTGVILLERK